MKRIIAFVAFMAITSITWGQTVLTPVTDTNTNVETRYITTTLLPSNSGNMTFQYVGSKVSGTVAGVVKLQGSLDGVNYLPEPDTLALTDVATNTKIWDITGKKRIKWRIAVTTSGTTKVANKGYFTERKQ
jgi:hypothetical protein